MHRVLLLNVGYEPLSIISWRRALGLILRERVDPASAEGLTVQGVSTALHIPYVLMMSHFQVSVVLPTKNEAHNIVPFLQSLPADIPLVVVDASDDNTPTLIAEHRPRQTRIIRNPARIAEARQIGAAAAETEWLLFTDADVVFAPDYFERIQACNDECDVIYGSKRSLDAYARYYRWFSRGQGLAHRLGVPAASGSNLLIRREALLACGGFDLRLPVNEDTEVVWRIKQRGYRVCLAPELIVYECDHRRLRRGAVRKTLHTLARCLLLYLNLMPDRWRSADWGYWS